MSGRSLRAGRRAFIEDARANGQFLRVTWHPERQHFVVSNWDQETCVGATRVRVGDVPVLMGVLADGLADAAASGPDSEERPVTLRQHLEAWWRQRTARAAVLELRRDTRAGSSHARRAG